MAKTEGAKFDEGTRSALKRMVNDGSADSKSDALQTLVIEGLARRGYLSGRGNRSSWLLPELARLCGYSGLAWAVMAAALSEVSLVWYALGLVALALAALALDRALDSNELQLGARLRTLVGGEKA